MQKGALQHSLHLGLHWQRKAHQGLLAAQQNKRNTSSLWTARETTPCSQHQLLLSSTSAAGTGSAHSYTGCPCHTLLTTNTTEHHGTKQNSCFLQLGQDFTDFSCIKYTMSESTHRDLFLFCFFLPSNFHYTYGLIQS